MQSSRRDPTAAVGAERRSRWAYLAAGWAGLFAALHVYWALGGAIGLAQSAGVELATARPAWFVFAGLWGVSLALLLAGGLALMLARYQAASRTGRIAVMLGWCVGLLLLIRGLGVQILLLTGAFGVADAVGADQVRWGLVLWNPWFVAGGAVFVLAGYQRGVSSIRAESP